jgi:hypothetical protein
VNRPHHPRRKLTVARSSSVYSSSSFWDAPEHIDHALVPPLLVDHRTVTGGHRNTIAVDSRAAVDEVNLLR